MATDRVHRVVNGRDPQTRDAAAIAVCRGVKIGLPIVLAEGREYTSGPLAKAYQPAASRTRVRLRVTKWFPAPLTDVYAWCTDFQGNDPELSRVRLRTRKVLRRERNRIEMEETGVLGFPFSARFLVDLRPPDSWEAHGRSNMGYTDNTYRLVPEREGTRLEATFDLHLTGPYRLFAPFVRGFILRRISREWDEYVRAMESGR